MKRIISALLAIVMLLGCSVILASCGAPKNKGAEISVYLGEDIYDFDPTDYCVDSNAEQVMSLLFEPLFTLNKNGKVEKAAAGKYSIDKEDREIVITLKESYWSDAIRVTAADYIYAWRDIVLEPNNANTAAALFYDIEGAYSIKSGATSVYEFGAVASGTYEITIKYNENADPQQILKNLTSVATAPLRQDIVTDYTIGYWSKVMNSAVTNGPFRIESMDQTSFTIVRNEGYHQDPTVKNVTKIVRPHKLVEFYDLTEENFEVTYEDLQNKAVFYMGDATLADRKANKNNAITADDLSTYTYVFNLDNPLFAIKEVRQALSIAIDRNSIIDAITFGKAATGFIPYAVKDANGKDSFRKTDLISATANTDKANQLLSSVNLTSLDKSFELKVQNTEEELAIAEIVKTAWESLNAGFKVTIVPMDTVKTKINDFSTNTEIEIYDSEAQLEVKSAAKGDRNFDVIAVDWQMYSTDAFVGLASLATSYSGCGMDFATGEFYGSFGGYSDSRYDTFIAAAHNAYDKNAKSVALHEAEAYVVDSACVVPLVFNQTFAFVNEDISKVQFDGLGNVVFTDVKQKNYEDYLD